MPYTPAQCKKFAAMSKRGEKVPSDWRKHCKKSTKTQRKRWKK